MEDVDEQNPVATTKTYDDEDDVGAEARFGICLG